MIHGSGTTRVILLDSFCQQFLVLVMVCSDGIIIVPPNIRVNKASYNYILPRSRDMLHVGGDAFSDPGATLPDSAPLS